MNLNWLNHEIGNQYERAHTHAHTNSLISIYLILNIALLFYSHWTRLCTKALENANTRTSHSVNLIHSVESTNWIINEVQALTFPMSMVDVTWIILIHSGLYSKMNVKPSSIPHSSAAHHAAVTHCQHREWRIETICN